MKYLVFSLMLLFFGPILCA